MTKINANLEIEKAAKILKVFDIKDMLSIAILALSKAIVDTSLNGYDRKTMALYIVFESARQKEIPITKNDFESLTRRKMRIVLMHKIRLLFRTLGYSAKPLNIGKIAEKITIRRDFPIELTSKFVEVTKNLMRVKYPMRENPRVAVCCSLILAAELNNYHLTDNHAIRIVFHNSKARTANRYKVKEFLPRVREILKVVYQWKQ